MSTSFFLRGADCSKAYSNFRGMRKWRELRQYAKKLWQIYEPFADSHFRVDARKHFFERYWEMYLTVALLANGARPVRVGPRGPEFFFSAHGKRIWIEAIAPGAGDGPDAVRENSSGTASEIPLDSIILRYTNALHVKNEKLQEEMARGIIAADDIVVIAINGAGIPYAPWGSTLPYLTQALLPIGPLTLSFDRATGQITDRCYRRKEAVQKKSGAAISTMPFLESAYSRVSAVIHSSAGPATFNRRLGADFFVLHNPLAINPLPTNVLAQWPQYHWSNDSLRIDPSTRRTSRRRMPSALRSVLQAPRLPFL